MEFLEWALEPAACPQESIVVMLDWFSAHLSPEVAELVARKGHVLLFHGGGVTGIEQVNETWPYVAVCSCLCWWCNPTPALLPFTPDCVHMRVLVDCYAKAASSCRWLDPTQSLVEDTHLHALFQRLLEQIEVQVAHAARKQDPDRIPKLSRQGILDLVREVPHSSSSSSSST